MALLLSVVPILLLIVLMLVLRMSGWKSAVVTLAATFCLMVFAAPGMGIVADKY